MGLFLEGREGGLFSEGIFCPRCRGNIYLGLIRSVRYLLNPRSSLPWWHLFHAEGMAKPWIR